jgi:hypothetical protein
MAERNSAYEKYRRVLEMIWQKNFGNNNRNWGNYIYEYNEAWRTFIREKALEDEDAQNSTADQQNRPE